jgi:putative ABC transport system permease protein
MGADSQQLLRSIFTKAALQLAAGVVVGMALGLLLDVASDGEMLGSFGRAMLPITSVVMIIVGMLATLGPARRGVRIQPTEALRAE